MDPVEGTEAVALTVALRALLELGGSDPFIVLDAEDMAATVKAATMGRMQNTGQACTASKRLIVTEDAFEPFVEGLRQAFTTFAPGDPADPTTSLAPAPRTPPFSRTASTWWSWDWWSRSSPCWSRPPWWP